MLLKDIGEENWIASSLTFRFPRRTGRYTQHDRSLQKFRAFNFGMIVPPSGGARITMFVFKLNLVDEIGPLNPQV